MAIQDLINCISGPRLYTLYKTLERSTRAYKSNALEKYSDSFLLLCSITFRMATYTSPLILYYYYRKGSVSFQPPYVNSSELYSLARFAFLLAIGYGAAFTSRGLGRYFNPDYQHFISLYTKLIKLPTEDFRKQKTTLYAYDFDFDFWPIEYRWKNSTLADLKRPPEPLINKNNRQTLSFPYNILAYIAIQTFGKRMMYPGTVGVLQFAMDSVIQDGRRTLMVDHHGSRFKLETYDHNYIDAMYIKSNDRNGSKLVICCEGNAGFYEIGVMSTPLTAGYSVLGWNHPGFGGSTGFPTPESEVNAIDTVMKFAIERLGYKQSNIIVFAWSIGGYPASWLAMQYPEIRGLILDATFDDVTELAVTKMPANLEHLVTGAVRYYFNLNISELLKYYHGPIRLIRRTKDEIISTNMDEPLVTNRANDIVIKLFRERFPKLMKDKAVEAALIGWLHQKRKYYPFAINNHTAFNTLQTYILDKGHQYPVYIGEGLDIDAKINIILYLASKTINDFNSTHCTNLPADLFQEPWDILKNVPIGYKL